MAEEANYNRRYISYVFRALALSGVLASIFINVSDSLRLQARQDYSLYFLVVMGSILLFSIFLFFPREIIRLARNMDLLVPFGIYLFIEIAITNFSSLPLVAILFSTEKKIVFWGFTAAVSLSSALWFINSVVFTGWTTKLILQLTKEHRINLVAGLQILPKRFFSVAFVLAAGWLIPILMFLPLIGSGFALANLHFFLFLTVVFTLFWNSFTYAVLFFAVDNEKGFAESITAGVKASWSKKWKVAFPIVLQLSLLGCFTYVNVTYKTEKTERNVTTVNDEENAYEEITNNYSTTTNTKWNSSADVIWIGGYKNDSEWHENLMKAVESKKLPITTFSIGFLLMILAILIKLRIAEKIFVVPLHDNLSIFNVEDPIEENNITEIEKEKPVFNLIKETDELNNANQIFLAVLILSTTFLIASTYLVKSLSQQSDKKVNRLNLEKEDEPEQANVNPHQFFKPRVLVGENFLSKRELYNAQNDSYFDGEKKNQSPAIYPVGYEGSYKPPTLFAPSFDVFVGECDGKEGRDIVFTSRDWAFILDETGNVKSRLKLGFGTLESAPYDPEEYYGPTEVIDAEGDGRCEYMGTGSDWAALFGSDGRGIWRTKKTEDSSERPTLAAGHILGDKKLQFVVVSNSLVELKSKSGQTIWKKSINEKTVMPNVTTKDIDGDEHDEIFITTFFKTIILNYRGEILKKLEPPVITQGVIKYSQNPDSITLLFGFKNNRLFFFDLNGKQYAKYKAPYSEQNSDYDNDPLPIERFSVFRAKATFVRLFKDKPSCLAVLGDLGGSSSYGTSLLYVYDDDGTLIYQEIFDEYPNGITAMPQSDENGTEDLLIGLDDIIWKYSVK